MPLNYTLTIGPSPSLLPSAASSSTSASNSRSSTSTSARPGSEAAVLPGGEPPRARAGARHRRDPLHRVCSAAHDLRRTALASRISPRRSRTSPHGRGGTRRRFSWPIRCEPCFVTGGRLGKTQIRPGRTVSRRSPCCSSNRELQCSTRSWRGESTSSAGRARARRTS